MNIVFFVGLLLSLGSVLQADEEPPRRPIDAKVGSSSNPSPTDHIGTGQLGDAIYRTLGGTKETGVSLEGLWIFDANSLLTGGIPDTDNKTFNNLLQFSLLYDSEKTGAWKGGLFAFEFLQLNGAQTNGNAGLAIGYEGLIQTPPLSRSQFYAWWYRQEFFDGRLITRVGKSTPNADFNCVNRLFPINDDRISPTASGVINGTIFSQAAMSASLPSYYNSAFGASLFCFPTKNFYLAGGAYDGNKARGVQTGIVGPEFNGYYFYISEAGLSWSDAYLPGRVAAGVWKQTGKLMLATDTGTLSQQGVYGLYFYASQRLWWKDKERVNSGAVTYLQLGCNNTRTLLVKRFLGWGITAYGLLPGRVNDSFGFGLSYAALNSRIAAYPDEWMFQTYYQCNLISSFYIEPVLSYIPRPGAVADLPPTWAFTIRTLGRF